MFLHRITTSVYAFLLAASFGMGAAHAGDGRPARHCTNASLKGEFAFSARGITLAALGLPAALTGPFASSGTAVYDGTGRVTLTATSSFNGIVQGPQTVHGTYTVNDDCSYTSQTENGATFRAAIVDGGRELLILQTNPGVVIAGTAESRETTAVRRNTEREAEVRVVQCTNAALAGSYGFLAEGAAGPPTIPAALAGPLDGVGVVTLNADGSFMMSAQRSVAGTIDPQALPLTGHYSLQPDCTFTMTFDAGFHFNATVIDRNRAVFIETDPGTSLIVRAKRI